MNFRNHTISFVEKCSSAFKEKLSLIFKDNGVLLIFFALPMLYPIVYALIYNPEVVRNVPVAIVDDCRTSLSRDFARDIDASPNTHIVSYCSNMKEAEDLMYKRVCYGIIHIPSDFSKKIFRGGEQSPVAVYCDMSLLLNYKSIFAAVTDVASKIGTELQYIALGGESLKEKSISTNPIESYSIVMYNPEEGYASFLIPAVLIIILQQSLLLGIGMITGSGNERIKGYENYYMRMSIDETFYSIMGKALAYFTIYIPNVLYVLFIIPMIFGYPQIGNPLNILIYIIPFIIASIFFSMFLASFCKERESMFILFVFTSLIFLFISGITWPKYAITPFFKIISHFIPSTSGIDGFIKLNSMGADLCDVREGYFNLWKLTLLYASVTFIIRSYKGKKSTKTDNK